ncbi:hypothetical protein [Flavobacterium sp. K5-23]|uniref:hypothetical protein n=1 Tax=Flavobacterium sp. K5-23 TaxID=2746225 RepID=UPI00200FCA42|nr:hypothetical protein [Flavobacterium sp. K5-23]UQD55039.1 hypothetical protein FLAK523_01000 [Flavobacterium sp. K5-23]
MKNIRYITLFLLSVNFGFAQVKDISFTLSPFAEYTWWDNQSGLEDGILLGGKLGFSFGEYVELRAIYLQSIDLKTNFDNFGINGFSSSMFNPQDITLTRWGGEFKANIGVGNLNPYVTLGTGVQNIEIDGGKDFDQIYASFGLGIKTKLTDRIVFSIEGKNTQYNFDAGKNLLTDGDKTTFGVTNADFQSSLLSNWSVQGSLQFYLGGRRPGTLSELDRAYLQKFKGGFKGLRWVVEPSMNYIEFDNDSSFRNTWLLGGYVGFDFDAYTGIRLFYLQATENDQLSTNFDKMAMYGVEFRARLNDGNGVSPYLVLGGGYLNPSSNYLGVNDVSVDGEEFASAGLGLNIPLSKNFLITGGARGMVTSSQDVEDLAGTDQLQTHMMYNAGMKLTFGAKSKSPSAVYQSQLDDALVTQDKISQEEYQKKLDMQKANNNQKLTSLKEKYQLQLDSLQVELEKANRENDVEKAVQVLEQKSETKKALNEVETVRKKSDGTTAVSSQEKVVTKEVVVIEKKEGFVQSKELVKMTPAELELLIDKILEETYPSKKGESQAIEVEQLNKRIDFLEKLILQNNGSSSLDKKAKGINEDLDPNKELIAKLDALKMQSELNSKKIDMLSSTPVERDRVVVVNPIVSGDQKTNVVTREDDYVEVRENVLVPGRFLKKERTSSNGMTYRGASGYLGANVGGQTTFNIGARINYGLRNTKIELMPEFYYGIANPSSFGLSGNFIYPFNALKFSEFMTPYAGIGAGLIKINDDVKAAHNIIIGTNLKFGKGRLFADFTARNFFKYNQFALGYRFDF